MLQLEHLIRDQDYWRKDRLATLVVQDQVDGGTTTKMREKQTEEGFMRLICLAFYVVVQ